MIVPDFYPDFCCKADTCRHSCCKQSWEIDIDPATADYYRQLPPPLGDELRQCVKEGPDGAYFAMENGQCHFLRPDGLCRLVRELGEDALCDICALHPRFFEYPLDAQGEELELGGTGLCCEKTCELLLTAAPLSFLDTENPAKQYRLAGLLKKLGLPLPPAQLAYQPDEFLTKGQPYLQKMLQLLEKTEPIDQEWTDHLAQLTQKAASLLSQMQAALEALPLAYYDRIYQYILYRQIETCPDSKKLAAFARFNTDFIFFSATALADLPEALRRWSEQIEYDTDNVELLFRSL